VDQTGVGRGLVSARRLRETAEEPVGGGTTLVWERGDIMCGAAGMYWWLWISNRRRTWHRSPRTWPTRPTASCSRTRSTGRPCSKSRRASAPSARTSRSAGSSLGRLHRSRRLGVRSSRCRPPCPSRTRRTLSTRSSWTRHSLCGRLRCGPTSSSTSSRLPAATRHRPPSSSR
jgi:hypothetical protein